MREQAPTLTPALSLAEGEGVTLVPSPPEAGLQLDDLMLAQLLEGAPYALDRCGASGAIALSKTQ